MILILQDPVVKVKKKSYPQTPLEECKCKIKKTKMENFMDDDLEKNLSDECDNEFDNGYNDETESEDVKDSDETN